MSRKKKEKTHGIYVQWLNAVENIYYMNEPMNGRGNIIIGGVFWGLVLYKENIFKDEEVWDKPIGRVAEWLSRLKQQYEDVEDEMGLRWSICYNSIQFNSIVPGDCLSSHRHEERVFDCLISLQLERQ